MPPDNRRINGPPETFPLSSFLVSNSGKTTTPTDVKADTILDKKDVRSDGRQCSEIRPIYLKAGVVQKANGSAYLETSGTKLTCSVFGPRDYVRKHDFSSSGKLTCELSFVPFARKERYGTGNKSVDFNAEYSSVITESLISAVCLNSYPKSQIDVYINVLEDDGNTLSYGIVAAAVALADAGIEMTDLVTSSSLVFNDDFYCLDPTEIEQCSKNITGKMTVAYLPSLNQISCLLQDGEVDVDKSVGMVNTCIEGCLRMHELMKDCLVSSYQSVVNEKMLNS